MFPKEIALSTAQASELLGGDAAIDGAGKFERRQGTNWALASKFAAFGKLQEQIAPWEKLPSGQGNAYLSPKIRIASAWLLQLHWRSAPRRCISAEHAEPPLTQCDFAKLASALDTRCTP